VLIQHTKNVNVTGNCTMKFFSPDETKEWLMSFQVVVNKNRTLSFPKTETATARTVFMNFPDKPLKLTYFLERVVDWLPRGRERFIMISDWHTYPPHPLAFFEAVRSGCGESRHIIDAPGLLIEADDGPRCQEFSESPSTPIFIGFALLVVNFDWQAYLIAKNDTSHIRLGDEYISFSTTDKGKLDEVLALADGFGLKIREAK
jgi:hypothetical protein